MEKSVNVTLEWPHTGILSKILESDNWNNIIYIIRAYFWCVFLPYLYL